MNVIPILQIQSNSYMNDLIYMQKLLDNQLKTLYEKNKDKKNANNSTSYFLNEVEKTHTVFISSSYKPSIKIGFEYFKKEYSNPKFGTTITLPVNQFGNFINDSFLNIKLSRLSAIDPRDKVRYVSMLGHRLIKKVQLLLNDNIIIDEYDTDDYNFYYQFEVTSDKKISYLRNIGQETPKTGYLTSDTTDFYQEYKTIGDGTQTLKYSHEDVELNIPLLFWFKDLRQSLRKTDIKSGQLQIRINLAPITEIIGFYDGGGGGLYNEPVINYCNLYTKQIFIDPHLHKFFENRNSYNIIRTHKAHKQIIQASDNQTYEIKLSNLKWPTEMIYIAFRPRENLELSQYWHRNTKLTNKSFKVPVVAKDPNTVILCSTLESTGNTVKISSIGLSLTDGFYVGYDFVITSGAGYNSINLDNKYTVLDYNAVQATITVDKWRYEQPNSTTMFELYMPQIGINNVQFYKEEPIIKSMSIMAYGIEIKTDSSQTIYSNYTSYYNKNIVSPEDTGSYIVPFCLNTLEDNTGGFINASKADLYLLFKSDIISKDYPVDLIVSSRAINFLTINNEGMSFKYTL